MLRSVAFIRLLFAACLALPSCFNPVHSDAVDALGPETDDERPGPRHRPGQPCLTCHGGEGPAPDFIVAGTVYAVRGQGAVQPGAIIRLTDGSGSVVELASNSAGNFYLGAGQWSPAFPIRAEVEFEGTKLEMKSRLNGTAGCANCHRGTGDSGHVPAVYTREK